MSANECFKTGIGSYGGIKNVNCKNIQKVLEELVRIAQELYAQITPVLSQALTSWDRCGLYTLMRIIDMVFGKEGMNSLKTQHKSALKKTQKPLPANGATS